MAAVNNLVSIQSAEAAWLLRRENALVRGGTHAAGQRPGAFLR
jgi:hypothetical protein